MLWRPALRSASYLHYRLGRAPELVSPRKAFLRQFTVTCQHRNTLPLASSTVRPAMTQILTAADGPLVWVDCEMTGLDSKTDRILEIAVLITDGNLELLDDGIEFIIKTDKQVLERMGDWCQKQHGQSGLTQACLASPYTAEHVRKEVLSYVKSRIPDQRVGVLAGNSVHADRAFLVNEMPDLTDHLHYRIVDVSSIKELCRRWYPQLQIPKDKAESSHRALNDIRASIRELQWYRKNIFIPTEL